MALEDHGSRQRRLKMARIDRYFLCVMMSSTVRGYAAALRCKCNLVHLAPFFISTEQLKISATLLMRQAEKVTTTTSCS